MADQVFYRGQTLKRNGDSSNSKYEKSRKRKSLRVIGMTEGTGWTSTVREMTCNICKKYGVGDCRNDQNFITGSTNFQFTAKQDTHNADGIAILNDSDDERERERERERES
jgi:hypothetical protein